MEIKLWCFGICEQLVFDADTIGSLKSMIQSKLSISDKGMEQRVIVIDRRDEDEVTDVILDGVRELPLDAATTTLDECGLKDGDSLRLGFKGPFWIQTVNLQRTDYVVPVSGCYETIGDFKRKYLEMGGELVLREEYFPRLLLSAPDDRTLLSFGFYKQAHDSECFNELPLQNIFCNPDGVAIFDEPDFEVLYPIRTKDDKDDHASKLQIMVEFANMPWRYPLFYEPTDTIGTVMKDIIAMHNTRHEILGQTYIKEGLFVIFLGEKQLENKSATLDECRIKHMDSIQVYEDELFPIVVDGIRVQSVDMKCFHTVDMLMDKLEVEFPKERQILIYKQWLLGDPKRRLVDYGIAKPVKYDESIAPKGYNNRPFWGRREEKFRIIILAFSTEEKPQGSRARDRKLKKASTQIHRISEALPINVDSIYESKPGRSGALKVGLVHKKLKNLLPPISPAWYHPHGPMLQVTVEIRNTHLRFPLTFEATDMIGTVRRAIIDKCHGLGKFNPRYIKEGAFVLFFNKQELENESSKLCSFGNMHMGSIELFEKASFNLRVVAPELKVSGNINVRGYDTVGALRDRLHRWTAIAKQELQMKYRDLWVWVGWFLDDDRRFLTDFGISHPYEYDGNLFPQEREIIVASSKRGLNATWDF